MGPTWPLIQPVTAVKRVGSALTSNHLATLPPRLSFPRTTNHSRNPSVHSPPSPQKAGKNSIKSRRALARQEALFFGASPISIPSRPKALDASHSHSRRLVDLSAPPSRTQPASSQPFDCPIRSAQSAASATAEKRTDGLDIVPRQAPGNNLWSWPAVSVHPYPPSAVCSPSLSATRS